METNDYERVGTKWEHHDHDHDHDHELELERSQTMY